MRRWHAEIAITRRNWRNHRRMHVESNITAPQGYDRRRKPGDDPFEVDCICDEQVGRFRKKDAYDCGKPHCFGCHSDKYPKRELTRQELIANKKLKELD